MSCNKPNFSNIMPNMEITATPTIRTWLTDRTLESAVAPSITSRNAELREALGINIDGTSNNIGLRAYRYESKVGAQDSWYNPGYTFPLFSIADKSDIDEQWQKGNGAEGFIDLNRRTLSGLTVASYTKLHEIAKMSQGFPYGCRGGSNSGLYKVQGFYGITLADNNDAAIVINQVAHKGEWDDDVDPIPFTRMVFLFILGEYEQQATGSKSPFRLCTAWRDYLMQDIVFLDFCFKSKDDAFYMYLRKRFGDMAHKTEQNGFLTQLAIDEPKTWTDKLRQIQVRQTNKVALNDVRKWEIASLISRHAFRIPPSLRTHLLRDQTIRSGDIIYFVLDQQRGKRQILGGFKLEKTASSMDATGQWQFVVTLRDSATTSKNAAGALIARGVGKDRVGDYSVDLKPVHAGIDAKIGATLRCTFDSCVLAGPFGGTEDCDTDAFFTLKSGMSVLIYASRWIGIERPDLLATTVNGELTRDTYATTSTQDRWIIYRHDADVSVNAPAPNAPNAPVADKAPPPTTPANAQPASSASSTTLAVTGVPSFVQIVVGTSAVTVGDGFVAEDADWAVSYALTAEAVDAVSLFSIGAVTYFGDKEEGTSKPIPKGYGERVLQNRALNWFVQWVVAYDAVAHPTLFDALKRPSTVEKSAEARLGVVAVNNAGDITLSCLSCCPRLATHLAKMPSATKLVGVSFVQMQLLVDYTSSYFMSASDTRHGKLICRAFRLVAYNIGAILALVVIVVMLVDERSPVAVRRIRRISKR